MSRKVLWSPAQASQFATCSGSDLRLSDYDHASRAFKTSAVVSDLPAVKTFAWTTLSDSSNLFAVGTASGRTILLSLNDVYGSNPSSFTLSTKHARPVNCLAFSPASNLLACGLDKARENGLFIYDTNSSDNKPLVQFGMSEGVSSAAFTAVQNRSSVLLAAMGGKWLRAYDFRISDGDAAGSQREPQSATTSSAAAGGSAIAVRPASTVSQMAVYPTRAISGVTANPWDENSYASYGDDSVVRLWDLRKSSEPVLGFSDADVWGEDKRPTTLLSALFSPTTPGYMTTMGTGSTDAPRFWTLASRTSLASSGERPTEWTVLSEQSGRKPSKAPASMAFVSIPQLGTSSSAVTLSKDGAIEIFDAPRTHHLGWTIDNDLAVMSRKIGVFGRQVAMPGERQVPQMTEEEEGNTLDKDIASTMKARLSVGYSADAAKNVNIVHDSLKEGWRCIEHMWNLASDPELGFVDRFDLAFVGVRAVFTGVNRLTQDSASLYKHKQKGGSGVGSHDQELESSLKTIARRCGWQPSSIKTPSAFSAKRLFALGVCGEDFATDDVEKVVRRKEQAGDVEAAAAHALFSGDTDRAIKALMTSDDDRLRLLAPSLARQASLGSQATMAAHSNFRELCNSLSNELDSPHLRAIFAYLGSGDWEDVVYESGLPLAERTAVALRYLSDKALLPFLERTADVCIGSGNLEGLVLTGLTKSGLALIQNYLDRTGDVQTAALAAAYVYPARLNDERAERWTEAYRSLLDTWECYMARAQVDIERGSMMRSTASRLRAAGRKDATVLQFQPTRLFVRCSFCNTTISSTTSTLNSTKRRGRATTCPTCSKSFPKCSICLEAFSIPEMSATDVHCPAWAWCATCRHGGHHEHLLEWFAGHEKCPVAGCHCRQCKPKRIPGQA